MPVAIQLENVSKRYRTGRSRTIVDLVASSVGELRGKTTEVHSATRGKIDSTIHALRDVSFEVREGAGLGIIGRNGAGKTTLLKLISRVTWPTSGKVRVAGHVVSLIELGAGFHPELTGRENVYLGGGLFGLTRKEIDRQFDKIVTFADVERLIDTPMKRYSSGLYARLGFSVAIHSNPDIVLVDEVLSVGDASFRRQLRSDAGAASAGAGAGSGAGRCAIGAARSSRFHTSARPLHVCCSTRTHRMLCASSPTTPPSPGSPSCLSVAIGRSSLPRRTSMCSS